MELSVFYNSWTLIGSILSIFGILTIWHAHGSTVITKYGKAAPARRSKRTVELRYIGIFFLIAGLISIAFGSRSKYSETKQKSNQRELDKRYGKCSPLWEGCRVCRVNNTRSGIWEIVNSEYDSLCRVNFPPERKVGSVGGFVNGKADITLNNGKKIGYLQRNGNYIWE